MNDEDYTRHEAKFDEEVARREEKIKDILKEESFVEQLERAINFIEDKCLAQEYKEWLYACVREEYDL